MRFSVEFFDEKESVAYGCEWGWPDDTIKCWTMSFKDGTTWANAGSLTEKGRGAILKKFGLTDLAPELPLEVVALMSPEELAARRRALEKKNRSANPLRIESDQVGNRVVL